MSKKIDIPKLDWFERYKRLIDAAWGIMLADEDFVYRKWGKEALAEFLKTTRPKWSGAVGKKLVEKLGLKPSVEEGIRLMAVYTQEVWGFGDPQHYEAKLETPNKGTFTILACRGWEKAREHSIETQCDIPCLIEFRGLVATLSPNIKITSTKARPRGDDLCQYTIEM